MPKLTLSDLTSLTSNEANAVSTINANMALIETAMENTLSRDGTSPNTMSADLDLNGNDLLNSSSDLSTVSGLGSAATAGAGARRYVTDATVTTFASTVVGGGSSKVPVYSDGTNWKIG